MRGPAFRSAPGRLLTDRGQLTVAMLATVAVAIAMALAAEVAADPASESRTLTPFSSPQDIQP